MMPTRRDGLGGQRVVAGHHEDPDPRLTAGLDRGGDLRPWRIEHADQAQQWEPGLCLLLSCPVVGQRAYGHGQHPQRGPGHLVPGGRDVSARLVVQRHHALPVPQMGATGQ